ncbi:SHS2 domain-containing protein [Natronorubrum sediminis]|uniref:SHS2 domain-containing protein n=1 Tax=Natronorubrum sediminis TaxID=640943 RepID=A0A1H6G080_9EURY|nr:archease [Natronorubrum sediminis]SEH15315.1 SHS2 domain-containing protein [Natronorubrum sediminis]
MTRSQDERFELRDHTADIAVEATGDSLEDVFGAVADGLAAASCDSIPEEATERFSLEVSAEGLEALLFDYLDELIYLRDVRAELPVDHHVEQIRGPEDESAADATGTTDDTDTAAADEWVLEASARGVSLADIHAREIKAVTYSEMRLERFDDDGGGDGWEAYVVFDV